jgi:hypothetical protein
MIGLEEANLIFWRNKKLSADLFILNDTYHLIAACGRFFIGVKMAGIKELSARLQSLKKQIPFATAQALTSVARQIAAAEKTAFQRKLDNPTPFTVNSVGASGARRDNLVATVFVRDIAAGYLEPLEFGGVHKLNGHALLNPKNIKLNKYGNLARNKLSQLKAKPDVFIGDIDGINGVWQRVKKKKGKKGKRRQKRSATVR